MKLILKLFFQFFQFIFGIKNISYYGASIFVPPGIDWKTKLQIYTRRYERAEIDAIMKYWNHSSSILEIGGGAGILANVIDTNLSPTKHLIYEPIESNFNCIKKQKLLTTTEVHNFAVVSSESNTSSLKFRIRERVFGSGFFSDGVDSIDTDEFIEVPTIKVNEVINQNFDVILMDVEGYEEVLLPELASLTKSTIIFEYHRDKCQIKLSELFNACPNYTFTHFQDCTFIGIPS